MYFLFSKTVYQIFLPFNWLLFLLIFALWTKNPKHRKRAILATLSVFLFFGNTFIVNEITTVWEGEAVLFSEVPAADIAVVLTGVTEPEKSPKDRLYFKQGADRVLSAVRLWQEGKVQKILITGTYSGPTGKSEKLAYTLTDAFRNCGVPDSVLITETKARTTAENAHFTAKMIEKMPGKPRLILVTSAFHMRRAAACFRKVGLDPQLFPTDFHTKDRDKVRFYTVSDMAFHDWHVLIKEWIGLAAYRFMGRV